MASLFRRKSAELVEESPPDRAGEVEAAAAPTEQPESESRRGRGYTPSKKELGQSTPKRPSAHARRPGTAPVTGRPGQKLTKEERREVREERRQRRREVSEGMRRGDERYLTGRDRGPERALARDVVDSRRTVGTWFFAGALVVLLGSSAAMPPEVRLGANLLWALLAVGVIVDSWLLCRRVKRLVRQRHPESTEKLGSLYLYVVMRSITFRRMRIPKPRVELGAKI